MKFQKYHFYLIFLLIAVSGACATAPTTTNVNSNTAPVTGANSNIVSTTTANIAATPATNASLPPLTIGSPSATIAAYYQATVKKDEAAFRKVLSQATLREFSADAQAAGEKSLVKNETDYSSPPKQPYETRNERISGDTAVIETKDSDTGIWSWKQLVRENGEWKLDLTAATSQKMLEMSKKN